MFRRSVLQLSSRQSVAKIPVQITSQIPSYLSSRGFSATSNQPELSGPTPNENQKSPLLKIFGGGLLLGSVSYATYHYNLVGKYLLKEPQINTNKTLQDFPKINENLQQQEVTVSEDLNANIITPKPSEETVETVEKTVETDSDSIKLEDSKLNEEKIEIQEKEDINHIEEEKKLNTETNESLEEKKPEIESDIIQNNPDLVQNEAIEYIISEELPQVQTDNITEQKNPLHDEYYLTEKKSKDLNEGYISKDGKLVLDFLEAIHEAEKRQAYLDARTFNEEMRLIKEKYDKELKDARARELMYAEKEVILDKELTRERAKAVAALKSLQEKLEEKHKLELEAKEKETELKLKEIQELAKAELTAAITSEKASQIEKMTEANIHINALCMAFYARSEEARQSHSVHKLALGALALEDALSKGLPIQKEIEAIKTYIEGIDKDSFLDLVLSSLPEEPRTKGTDTLLQLNEKFDGLKQTLRHFSLIPPGGGGILAHSLAHVASRLKVKDVDLSGEGIESVISKVEKLLGQGKLSEAANTLEEGVKGSQAEEIVEEWVTRVRYRAIAEQALVLLQSYATSISLN